MPRDVALSPIWLLGSSGYSATAAGKMGLGYAFASHFSPADPAPAMRAYRENFEPSEDFGRPSAVLAVAVICGETGEAKGALQALKTACTRISLRTSGPRIWPAP